MALNPCMEVRRQLITLHPVMRCSRPRTRRKRQERLGKSSSTQPLLVPLDFLLPPSCRVAKAFNWEGIVITIFMSLVLARLFPLADQAADLHQEIARYGGSAFVTAENQTLIQQTFMLNLNRQLRKFEIR